MVLSDDHQKIRDDCIGYRLTWTYSSNGRFRFVTSRWVGHISTQKNDWFSENLGTGIVTWSMECIHNYHHQLHQTQFLSLLRQYQHCIIYNKTILADTKIISINLVVFPPFIFHELYVDQASI